MGFRLASICGAADDEVLEICKLFIVEKNSLHTDFVRLNSANEQLNERSVNLETVKKVNKFLLNFIILFTVAQDVYVVNVYSNSI